MDRPTEARMEKAAPVMAALLKEWLENISEDLKNRTAQTLAFIQGGKQ